MAEGKVNPIQVQKFLSGIDYPVEKAQVVETARNEGADESVIEVLNRLPDQTFNGPNAISEAIGKIQ